jgi:hypothetical protein
LSAGVEPTAKDLAGLHFRSVCFADTVPISKIAVGQHDFAQGVGMKSVDAFRGRKGE